MVILKVWGSSFKNMNDKRCALVIRTRFSKWQCFSTDGPQSSFWWAAQLSSFCLNHKITQINFIKCIKSQLISYKSIRCIDYTSISSLKETKKVLDVLGGPPKFFALLFGGLPYSQRWEPLVIWQWFSTGVPWNRVRSATSCNFYLYLYYISASRGAADQKCCQATKVNTTLWYY